MSENNSENLARLDWIDETIPLSRRFDDPYFSIADGFAETTHTFMNGNNLSDRFAPCERFTIAELGFGTGLNFLATKKLWSECAPAKAQLDYISFEQFPMSKSDLEKSLSRWPMLAAAASELAGYWNPEFEFLEAQFGNVHLIVFFSDANIRLPQLEFSADAWFLDGFSPAKNPELWSSELMQQVFKNTRPGGTFATYTSAGWVRRNLQAAGFTVQRIKGHGNKRQMTVGARPE